MITEIMTTNSRGRRHTIVKVRGEIEEECQEMLELLSKTLAQGADVLWRREAETHKVRDFLLDSEYYEGNMRFSVPKEGT